MSDWLKCSHGSCSLRGLRERNEDTVFASDDLLVVCDGVGGAEFGDVASAVACRSFVEGTSAGKSPFDAFVQANEAVCSLKGLTGTTGTGSTLVAARIDGRRLAVVWSGDSAGFLIRRGRVDIIARPQREEGGFLVGGLGYERALAPFEATEPLLPGDCVVLCSDGVWSNVDMGDIADIVAEGEGNAPLIAHHLAESGARGGTDNASAVVLYVE